MAKLSINMNYYDDNGVLKGNGNVNYPGLTYKQVVEVQKAVSDSLHGLADKRIAEAEAAAAKIK